MGWLYKCLGSDLVYNKAIDDVIYRLRQRHYSAELVHEAQDGLGKLVSSGILTEDKALIEIVKEMRK